MSHATAFAYNRFMKHVPGICTGQDVWLYHSAYRECMIYRLASADGAHPYALYRAWPKARDPFNALVPDVNELAVLKGDHIIGESLAVVKEMVREWWNEQEASQ